MYLLYMYRLLRFYVAMHYISSIRYFSSPPLQSSTLQARNVFRLPSAAMPPSLLSRFPSFLICNSYIRSIVVTTIYTSLDIGVSFPSPHIINLFHRYICIVCNNAFTYTCTYWNVQVLVHVHFHNNIYNFFIIVFNSTSLFPTFQIPRRALDYPPHPTLPSQNLTTWANKIYFIPPQSRVDYTLSTSTAEIYIPSSFLRGDMGYAPDKNLQSVEVLQQAERFTRNYANRGKEVKV